VSTEERKQWQQNTEDTETRKNDYTIRWNSRHGTNDSATSAQNKNNIGKFLIKLKIIEQIHN